MINFQADLNLVKYSTVAQRDSHPQSVVFLAQFDLKQFGFV
jgi:hypothetical protein